MKKLILLFLLSTGVVLSGACQQGEKSQAPEVSVDSLKAELAKKDIVLLDVRTPEEYADGHIEGAINIDYKNDNFESRIDSLDKTKKYEVYCRSGHRSGESAKLMKAKGFDVYSLSGGILEWQSQGNPVVK